MLAAISAAGVFLRDGGFAAKLAEAWPIPIKGASLRGFRRVTRWSLYVPSPNNND
jgi:hypothetical protein